VELIVLGAGGGWAAAGGAASGYLVRHEGFNVWVDQGNGTLANLQRHISFMDVHAVVVSHRHFDHFLDLYPFYLARWFRTERRPLPLYAPPGMFEHALKLEPDLVQALVPSVVEPGQPFEVGPFRVDTAPMYHPVPTLGMRFQAGGATLAYSADTGPTDRLVELARGCDVLLAEATWMELPEGAEPMHMTPEEAGTAGRRAEVGRLVLSHIWPTNPIDQVQERAAAAFGGPVTVASVGLSVMP
jgi:ribonuclease BN (tRNA processing enzyme)